MAVAYDASSEGGASFTHTPVGTPRGIWVGIAVNNEAADSITAVTYGGVTMTETSNSPLLNADLNEQAVVYSYFLGSSIPTGAQTVAITSSAGTVWAACVSVTASADTEIVTTNTINLDAVTGTQSDTIALSSRTCFVTQVAWSGGDANTACTALSGWTLRNDRDYTNQTAYHYTYDTIGSSDVTFGVVHNVTNGISIIAAAISEVVGGGGSIVGKGLLNSILLKRRRLVA